MDNDLREARRIALQILFELDRTGHDPWETLAERLEGEKLSAHASELATNLVSGVLDNKREIDTIIEHAAPAWPLDQMAVIDRVALEIGIFEVCVEKKVPVQVAINEAVELAKVFGGENSSGLVNGVLRTIIEREAAHSHS